MYFASTHDQKYPRYPLTLKFNVTLARPLRLVIPYFFKWKFLSDVRRLYIHDSKWNLRSDLDEFTPYKTIAKLIVHSIYDHGVFMHVKFHQDVISYRSYCPLIAYILMIFSIPSLNLVSNGWNLMKLIIPSIYDHDVVIHIKVCQGILK